MTVSAKLTLGPLLFNWSAERWRDFHVRIADEAPVDTVCLGEVVCSKRAPFFAPHVAEVVERLRAAGKEVVLSTLALIMTKRERDTAAETAAADDFLIEANDIGVADLMAGRPHAIGPYVNVYNEGSLAFVEGRGAVRICLPVELGRESLARLGRAAKAELEVQVFGRLPLALSARCYHARARNLAKDNCQYVCADDPDGMDLDTLDGQPFLAVNGIQTLSRACVNLLGELDELGGLGVRRFRLSPHTCDMVAVAHLFREVADGRLDPLAGDQRLAALVPSMDFSNGYFHGLEGVAFREAGGDAE